MSRDERRSLRVRAGVMIGGIGLAVLAPLATASAASAASGTDGCIQGTRVTLCSEPDGTRVTSGTLTSGTLTGVGTDSGTLTGIGVDSGTLT